MKANFATSTSEAGGNSAFTADQYTITVRKEDIDGELYFVGRVAEFPDVAVFEDSASAAYDGVLCVVTDLSAQLIEEGKAVPAPNVAAEEFSGRVTFRMPRSLHARIDAHAKVEGVSINTLLVAAAESYLGSANPLRRPIYDVRIRGNRPLDKVDVSPLTATTESAVVAMMGSITATAASFTKLENFDLLQISADGTFVDTFEQEDPIHRHYFSLRS